jgi:hypothetical protein
MPAGPRSTRRTGAARSPNTRLPAQAVVDRTVSHARPSAHARTATAGPPATCWTPARVGVMPAGSRLGWGASTSPAGASTKPRSRAGVSAGRAGTAAGASGPFTATSVDRIVNSTSPGSSA